jgi:hypothetical protein
VLQQHPRTLIGMHNWFWACDVICLGGDCSQQLFRSFDMSSTVTISEVISKQLLAPTPSMNLCLWLQLYM